MNDKKTFQVRLCKQYKSAEINEIKLKEYVYERYLRSGKKAGK
jgi:hypothetical protein